MPRLIVTAGAVSGMRRSRDCLARVAPGALGRAAQALSSHIQLLETNPEVGRPLPEAAELRELVIPFGDSGYVALYRYEAGDDAVYLLALRHQREAGY